MFYFTNKLPKRNFWTWINIIFNKVDLQRLKMFGPDRTCAEWLLRNGAIVKFKDHTDYTHNYNSLPVEGTPFFLTEIDATGSSIMHYGFPHFEGCRHISKIILHNCSYLQNEAIPMLKPLESTLNYLEISKCQNLTEDAFTHMKDLTKLNELKIFDLPYVKNMKALEESLKKDLPQCKIMCG